MLSDGADDGEFDFVYDRLPQGSKAFATALGINAFWAIIDAVSVAIDVRGGLGQDAFEKALTKAVGFAVARSPRALSTADAAKMVFAIGHNAINEILYALSADSVDTVISKIVGKSVSPVGIFYRLATGSQAVERVLSLVGLNWRMSPLETWVIVVGNPYTPRLEQALPEKPGPGDEIVLRGRNFDYRAVASNEVRIGDWWPSATPADVISVSQDGTELRFMLSDDASPGSNSVWIKVPYRATPVMFENALDVRRRPRLQPLRHDGRQDQDACEDEQAYAQAAGAQCHGQRSRQAEGRVDRHHDGQRPEPEAPFPIGCEQRHRDDYSTQPHIVPMFVGRRQVFYVPMPILLNCQLTVCVTGSWAGQDNAHRSEPTQSQNQLKNRGDSHESGARFVRCGFAKEPIRSIYGMVQV